MRTVVYEGVAFFAERCAGMSKSEFVKAHLDVFWPDRDPETRRKMLGKAYDLMAPPKEKTEE